MGKFSKRLSFVVLIFFSHNDLPYNLYLKLKNQISNFSFASDLSNDPVFGFKACSSCFTDLVRAKKGKLGAQFWVAYVGCDPKNYSTIVSRSIEQVDVIRRLVNMHSDQMEFVTTADGKISIKIFSFIHSF